MKTNFRKAPFAAFAARGFSLAEVAIAVAIASLGIITILGIIPTGLEGLRKAGDNIALARIYQQMISEVQSADWGVAKKGKTGWDKLDEYVDERRYFDAEGTLLDDSDSEFEFRISYVALYDFTKADKPVFLPGDEKAVDRADIKPLVVRVAVSTDKNFDFEDDDRVHQSRAFTLCRQF